MRALTKYKYPRWALDKVEKNLLNNSQEDIDNHGEPSEEGNNNSSGNTTGRTPTREKHRKGHIVIPYIQGPGESIKKTCSKYGIQTHFKGEQNH